MSANESTTKKARRTVTWNDDNTTMTIDFLTAGLFSISISDFSEIIIHRFAAHGMEQKFRDNLARGKDTSLTDAEALNETKALLTALMSGEWSKKKSSAPSVKVSDMEQKFIEAVKLGTLTMEQAINTFTTLTGKPWTLGESVFPSSEKEDTEEEDTEE